MADFDVTMRGLDEFDRSLARLAGNLPATMRIASLESATLVVDTARPTVPRRSGRAASSLQAYATGERAVAGGGEGVVYYRWLELGGAAGAGHAVVRARSDGRYIKPAYERRAAEIGALLEESLRAACRDAGLEVT